MYEEVLVRSGSDSNGRKTLTVWKESWKGKRSEEGGTEPKTASMNSLLAEAACWSEENWCREQNGRFTRLKRLCATRTQRSSDISLLLWRIVHKSQERTKSKQHPPLRVNRHLTLNKLSKQQKKPKTASCHLPTVNTNQHEATSCSGVPSCAVRSAAPGWTLVHTFLSKAPCFILGYQHLGGKD